jgi:hypothetical protein
VLVPQELVLKNHSYRYRIQDSVEKVRTPAVLVDTVAVVAVRRLLVVVEP